MIHHILYSQAGSIGKALIELIMNCGDAAARQVVLTITNDGFSCTDDGNGFASRKDVVKYFGRFGTPHQEGDVRWGRFRLGRGQIMPHASTVWKSRRWKMTVDVNGTGYGYDLDVLRAGEMLKGCEIKGTWYERLSDVELMSTIQEVRDLVRYMPLAVLLNGQTITRNPATEKWDFEDEFAYYRAKSEGAVSIYNQGVLVRHDASQLWGAGGVIVSKRAISLNVSRTEILRKTCPVWKPIARQFAKMAEEVSARLGSHRKTEARREKAANDLLGGAEKIAEVFTREEVITLLPGKRHFSMFDFFHKHGARVSVVTDDFDVPKGEALAQSGIATIVHPQTLARFGCHSPEDFRDTMQRVVANVRDAAGRDDQDRWLLSYIGRTPELLPFETLRDEFVERSEIVSEKDVLDKETRRAWTALRWCLEKYVRICASGSLGEDGRLHRKGGRVHVLLGRSNVNEAWTDGLTYIAISMDVVRGLKANAVTTAAYIFGLLDHEIAHEGDSLDCGHDEAFYQRYHDISLLGAPERQRLLHVWLMKYTRSMEMEGRRPRGDAWRERYLVDRAGSGREKRGLPRAIEDVSSDPLVAADVPEENMGFIESINADLVLRGACPQPPDWNDVIERARARQVQRDAEREAEHQRLQAERVEDDGMWEAMGICEIEMFFSITTEQAQDVFGSEEARAFYAQEKHRAYEAEELARILAILGITAEQMPDAALRYLWEENAASIESLWQQSPWEQPVPDEGHGEYKSDEEMAAEIAEAFDDSSSDAPQNHLEAALWSLVRDGETWWSLERNAAAAGFLRVEHYLKWRAEDRAEMLTAES
ncbi:ATP-binding protein [Paraburkholderia domus]|uniref:ATP-binding protein n=1 Tax=Paraburkholderia domus TaxID=2793075 RepID=UPI001EF128C4|nr:ATP-binding protein [Paraburkholderia domus]